MPHERESKPSRTAQKRAAKAIEELARKLVELPEATGKKLPLTAEIRKDLQLARTTKGHSARDRQIRHLAAVLREEEDLSSLVEFLDGQDRREWEARQRFHQLEAWRDRLCHPADFPAALVEVKRRCRRSMADRLARLAGAVHAHGDQHAAREIFRLLREAKSLIRASPHRLHFPIPLILFRESRGPTPLAEVEAMIRAGLLFMFLLLPAISLATVYQCQGKGILYLSNDADKLPADCQDRKVLTETTDSAKPQAPARRAPQVERQADPRNHRQSLCHSLSPAHPYPMRRNLQQPRRQRTRADTYQDKKKTRR